MKLVPARSVNWPRLVPTPRKLKQFAHRFRVAAAVAAQVKNHAARAGQFLFRLARKRAAIGFVKASISMTAYLRFATHPHAKLALLPVALKSRRLLLAVFSFPGDFDGGSAWPIQQFCEDAKTRGGAGGAG